MVAHLRSAKTNLELPIYKHFAPTERGRQVDGTTANPVMG